jgi:hypothetical protein
MSRLFEELDRTIEALSVGLKNDFQRQRLRAGITYLASGDIEYATPGLHPYDAFKVIAPIFTRTVHNRDHLDVPVRQYVDELIALLETMWVKREGEPDDREQSKSLPYYIRLPQAPQPVPGENDHDYDAMMLGNFTAMFVKYYDSYMMKPTWQPNAGS